MLVSVVVHVFRSKQLRGATTEGASGRTGGCGEAVITFAFVSEMSFELSRLDVRWKDLKAVDGGFGWKREGGFTRISD